DLVVRCHRVPVSSGLAVNGGLAGSDAHFLQRQRHRVHGLLDLFRSYGANTAYAKSLDLCQLARVENKPVFLCGLVEGLEVIARIARRSCLPAARSGSRA